MLKRAINNRLKTLTGRPHELNAVFVETTRACTNRCYMCPARKREEQFGVLSDKNFKKVIDELSSYNYSKQLHLYGQSEPFADKKIFDRIDYARDKLPDANIVIISNFVNLNDKNIDRLVNSPITRLTTSIYAFDSDSYKKICGRDHFKRAIINLIKFSKKWAKDQPYNFTINLISSEFNKHDSEFIEYFLDQFPCDERSVPALFNLRGVLEKSKTQMNFDPWIYSLVKVDVNGDMSCCVIDVDSKLLMGNIANDSLMDVFHSQKAQKIRNDLFYGRGCNGVDFCDNCEFSNQNKLMYFFVPHYNTIQHKIYSLLNITSPGKYGQIGYKKVKNSTQQVKEKLICFEGLFNGDSDSWLNIILELRNEFYSSNKVRN